MGARSRSALIMGVTALSTIWLAGSPAGAQSQTTPALAAKSEVPDTVTIFAKRRPYKPAATRGGQITTIDHNKASNCGFNTNLRDVEFGNIGLGGTADTALKDAMTALIFLSGDEVMQDYFADFGVENGNYGAQAYLGTDPLTVGGGYSDTSPFGNASTGDTGTGQRFTTELGKPGSCTAADSASAAGRSDIARHDKSMQMAFAALDAKDYPKAMVYFKQGYQKLAYGDAALIIGQMYLAGLGTPRDSKEAIVWLRKAAESPYDPADKLTFDPAAPYYKNARVEADVTLANIYATGFDVPKSPRDARKWYQAANEYGYVPATFILGRMAAAGYGGAPDATQAVAYYKSAGEAGFAPAQYRLGQLYYTGADGVAQDKTKAGAWLLLAAKTGYPDALYAVGRMYELGEGGAKADLPTALIYYKEAAIKGQIDAQTTLATYLYTGEGGAPKDLDTARKLFQAAAEQGDPDAMFNLGVMMVNGEGGPKDLVRAYCWFYIAQKGGVEKAGAALKELSGKMTADERAQAGALLNPAKS